MLQLNDVVREVLKLTEHDLQVEGVSVTTEYDDNLPRVDVDHTQIQQVILNLVKNAIDAMRGVSLSKRHLRVLTGFDGKLVALYVQDTGPGIGVKDRDRIFEPFFTTKPTVRDWGCPSVELSSKPTVAFCGSSKQTHRAPVLR